MKEVLVPKLGLTMEEAYIVKVLINVGDTVKVEDDLFEIETDKVSTTIKSEFDGVVKEILAKEDDTLPIGAVVATLE